MVNTTNKSRQPATRERQTHFHIFTTSAAAQTTHLWPSPRAPPPPIPDEAQAEETDELWVMKHFQRRANCEHMQDPAQQLVFHELHDLVMQAEYVLEKNGVGVSATSALEVKGVTEKRRVFEQFLDMSVDGVGRSASDSGALALRQPTANDAQLVTKRIARALRTISTPLNLSDPSLLLQCPIGAAAGFFALARLCLFEVFKKNAQDSTHTTQAPANAHQPDAPQTAPECHERALRLLHLSKLFALYLYADSGTSMHLSRWRYNLRTLVPFVRQLTATVRGNEPTLAHALAGEWIRIWCHARCESKCCHRVVLRVPTANSAAALEPHEQRIVRFASSVYHIGECARA